MAAAKICVDRRAGNPDKVRRFKTTMIKGSDQR
jgi:hypothetical protein